MTRRASRMPGDALADARTICKSSGRGISVKERVTATGVTYLFLRPGMGVVATTRDHRKLVSLARKLNHTEETNGSM